MRYSHRPWLMLAAMMAAPLALQAGEDPEPAPRELAGTRPLTLEGDIAATMIAGVDRFLLREIEASIGRRVVHWRRDTSSAAAYARSVDPNRQRLAEMIGLRPDRVDMEDLDLVATRSQAARVGLGEGFEVFAVRWPVLDGVHGEGVLLVPTGQPPRADVVVIPDCEQSPEALVGILPGVAVESQMARRLAEGGCRVLVPTLIDRGSALSVIADGRRRSSATHREMLYRAAFQMGRHLIGYEVHKVLAAVDWFAASAQDDAQKIGVVGYGEGGLLALYAAAVDPRIQAAGVSGYFDSRQNLWREPIDRNVFGLLRESGDAEIATLIAPRALVIEACAAPARVIAPGGDSAPAELATPDVESVRSEVRRARELAAGLTPAPPIELVVSRNGDGPFGSEPFLQHIMRHLADRPLAPPGRAPRNLREQFDPAQRLARQYQELARFSQRLVEDGPHVRARLNARIDRSSGVEAFAKSVEPYRACFRDEIIGLFDHPLEKANPRTRLLYDEPSYRGYDVVLDVFPDVILYGILLVPKDLRPGEQRPLVVCQHGLEGRAQSTVEGDQTSYRDFASRLARRGFITFSPQHLYRGEDRFRTLQRKANPLKKSLFSVMVAQHRQLLDWLGGLEFVDRGRIAFYGISYGGKSAMRIPALLDGYCLSICSSDFSDWISRTVSDRLESGYLAHNEYEIFEFGLGGMFNYADLAALVCPRPFMVEEFHHHGLVADMNGAEYAKVRLLYENLGIRDRTRMSYYGAFQPTAPYAERETFEFLHDHLRWPRP